MTAPGHVAADAIERHRALFNPDTGRDIDREDAGTLASRHTFHVTNGFANRPADASGCPIAAVAHLARGDFDGSAIAIQPPAPGQERRIAAALDVADDTRGLRADARVARAINGRQA